MLEIDDLSKGRDFSVDRVRQYLAVAVLAKPEGPQTGPLAGCVDLVTRDHVVGWAFHTNYPDSPVLLEIMDGDELLVRIMANQPRPDVAAAGNGNGNCGFDVRLPGELSGNPTPKIYVRRASDKTPIGFHQFAHIGLAAVATTEGSDALIATSRLDIDLLASPITHTFRLELTSRCNLRCVYCAVSQPGYDGVDMDIVDFDSLVQQLKARRVRKVAVNGHGETTMIPDWHHKIMRLADEGLCMSIITNFARLLRQEELEAVARISEIMVSIDTHRPELQQVIRRRVDIGNILINMSSVTATASKLGLPKPKFIWSCVVTDQVALDLVDYIHFGLACGVRHFALANLTKYDDIEGAKNVQHVTTLPATELRQFSDLLEQARTIIASAGGSLTIQSGLMTPSIRNLQGGR